MDVIRVEVILEPLGGVFDNSYSWALASVIMLVDFFFFR